MARKVVCIVMAAMLLTVFVCGQAEGWTEKQLLSYYDNCVFVGDSITDQLKTHVREKQQRDPEYMAKTRFFSVINYFLYTASRKYLMQDFNNLTLGGREYPLCELIGMLKPKRVLILLGVNDMIGEKISQGVEWCERIVDLIAETSPETEVIFQSLTPVRPGFSRRRDFRALWDQYNEALEAMCARRGVGYLDIATPLKDGDGYLREEYCRDGEYHLTDAGLQVWLNTLAQYAASRAEAGLWTPEAE